MAEMFDHGTMRTSDGLNLYFRRDVPRRPKGIIVFLHSLGEHSGRYDTVARVLNDAGYGVYRFDCRGHGRSDGPRGDVQDFRDYLQDVDILMEDARATFPELPVFIIGHSMGGLVAASYAVQNPDKMAGEVLMSAAVRRMPALDFLSADGRQRHRERGDERFSLLMPHRSGKGDRARDNDRLMLDSVTVRLAGNVWFQGADWFEQHMSEMVTPLFILHGADDDFIPPEAAMWFYDGVSSLDRSLRLYPNRGHMLLDESHDVLDDVVKWLDAHGRDDAYRQY